MLPVLLVGCGMVLASVVSCGIATAIIVEVAARLMRSSYTGNGFGRNMAIMMIVTLITAVAHLIQIALWAVVFVVLGEMASFADAFYFSAESYTSLGYGDIVLSGRWRLLGPLEAMDGLLLFGISTALMFAIMSRLATNHLHSRFGAWEVASGSIESPEHNRAGPI